MTHCGSGHCFWLSTQLEMVFAAVKNPTGEWGREERGRVSGISQRNPSTRDIKSSEASLASLLLFPRALHPSPLSRCLTSLLFLCSSIPTSICREQTKSVKSRRDALGWICRTAVPPRGQNPSQGDFSRASTPGDAEQRGGEQSGLLDALLGVRAPKLRAPPALGASLGQRHHCWYPASQLLLKAKF